MANRVISDRSRHRSRSCQRESRRIDGCRIHRLAERRDNYGVRTYAAAGIGRRHGNYGRRPWLASSVARGEGPHEVTRHRVTEHVLNSGRDRSGIGSVQRQRARGRENRGIARSNVGDDSSYRRAARPAYREGCAVNRRRIHGFAESGGHDRIRTCPHGIIGGGYRYHSRWDQPVKCAGILVRIITSRAERHKQ